MNIFVNIEFFVNVTIMSESTIPSSSYQGSNNNISQVSSVHLTMKDTIIDN